ncbi:MAG TPA: sialidase family protein [Rariglobus sp.]
MSQANLCTDAIVPNPGDPLRRVINHLQPDTGEYIGSPSIALLPDGALVVSHDFFGPRTTEHTSAVTWIFRSEDRGATWRRTARIEPAFWSNLFVHGGVLYLLGTTHHHGALVIRRSADGGYSWTEPRDGDSGLLTSGGQYHTGPMPVLVQGGRLWRAVEDAGDGGVWGERYSPMLMSAPLDADLLRRESWTFTRPLGHSKSWLGGKFGGWLEGNAVATPAGGIANLLRVACPDGEKAALVTLEADGRTLGFSPERDFVDLPGGATKFTVRHDARSNHYWTLANLVPPRHEGSGNASLVRNTLALLRSADLRDWELRSVVLYHPDPSRHGFQYVDWLFDGADIVAVSRTAHDDARGGARKAHDANYLTFHRLVDFRDATPADSVVPLSELQTKTP